MVAAYYFWQGNREALDDSSIERFGGKDSEVSCCLFALRKALIGGWYMNLSAKVEENRF